MTFWLSGLSAPSLLMARIMSPRADSPGCYPMDRQAGVPRYQHRQIREERNPTAMWTASCPYGCGCSKRTGTPPQPATTVLDPVGPARRWVGARAPQVDECMHGDKKDQPAPPLSRQTACARLPLTAFKQRMRRPAWSQKIDKIPTRRKWITCTSASPTTPLRHRRDVPPYTIWPPASPPRPRHPPSQPLPASPELQPRPAQ